jgi:DNA polymerase V
MDAVTELFDRIVDKNFLVRRVNITANHVVDERSIQKKDSFKQLTLFMDYAAEQTRKEEEEAKLEREKNMQKAMLVIKKKYGKNAVLKGMNLEEGATTLDRNKQIGGHRA